MSANTDPGSQPQYPPPAPAPAAQPPAPAGSQQAREDEQVKDKDKSKDDKPKREEPYKDRLAREGYSTYSGPPYHDNPVKLPEPEKGEDEQK